MAEEAVLRAQLDEQRSQIGHTVDQIEDRVRPGRIVRRKRGQLGMKWTEWKDQVMGNDEYGNTYPADAYPVDDGEGRLAQTSHAVRDQASSVASSVGDAPETVRRQTRGNPVAPGLIAFGAGLLVAALVPETRREHELVAKVQPELDKATAAVADTGREIGAELQDSVQEAAASVKETATGAATETVDETRNAVR